MKVLLLGGSGLLGSALRASVPRDVTLDAPTHAMLDVSDASALERALDQARPDWVVNCVAFTAVDRAEVEREAAHQLNVVLPETLGRLAAARGVRVLQPSTDYVFDGSIRRPLREDDPVAPQSYYAETKLESERRVLCSGAHALVPRVTWLYGEGGRCFPRLMWERALQRLPARVVADQRGTPTHTADLASWLWQLMARDVSGVIHASGLGETTWAEIARRVYARAGFPEGVTETTAAEYGAPAARPLYSVLDCSRLDALIHTPRRPWEQAMDEFLAHRAAEVAA